MIPYRKWLSNTINCYSVCVQEAGVLWLPVRFYNLTTSVHANVLIVNVPGQTPLYRNIRHYFFPFAKSFSAASGSFAISSLKVAASLACFSLSAWCSRSLFGKGRLSMA